MEESKPITAIRVFYNLPMESDDQFYTVAQLTCHKSNQLIDQKSRLEFVQNYLKTHKNVAVYGHLSGGVMKCKLDLSHKYIQIIDRESNKLAHRFDLKNVLEVNDHGFIETINGTILSIVVSYQDRQLIFIFHCEANKKYTSADIVRNILKMIEENDDNYCLLQDDGGTKQLFNAQKLVQECSELNKLLNEIETFTNGIQQYNRQCRKIKHLSQSIFYPKKKIDKMRGMLNHPDEQSIIEVVRKIKMCFIYLARLKPYLYNPNASDIVQILFPILALLTNILGVEKVKAIQEPYLTNNAITFFSGNLQTTQYKFFQDLGENWNHPRVHCMMKKERYFHQENIHPISKVAQIETNSQEKWSCLKQAGSSLHEIKQQQQNFLERAESRSSKKCTDHAVLTSVHQSDICSEKANLTSDSPKYCIKSPIGMCENVTVGKYQNIDDSYKLVSSMNSQSPFSEVKIPSSSQKIRVRVKLVNLDDFTDENEFEKYLDEQAESSKKTSPANYSIIVKQMPSNFVHAQFCELTSEVKCVLDDNVLVSETHVETQAKEYANQNEEIVDV